MSEDSANASMKPRAGLGWMRNRMFHSMMQALDHWRHMRAFDPHPPDVRPNPHAPERRVCGTCGEALVRVVVTQNEPSDANPLVASRPFGPYVHIEDAGQGDVEGQVNL